MTGGPVIGFQPENPTVASLVHRSGYGLFFDCNLGCRSLLIRVVFSKLRIRFILSRILFAVTVNF